ncbi:hypothetical protein MLD38_014916 [Melastoma candidum]|uniref:Uncharacterized protein n=1 Tax=Melastoma candidum TaxID=119954 RepID=A0ACB9RHF1_9MYRT|nr:hypothetical protein MLD38_014916 [Melastoma candidum]
MLGIDYESKRGYIGLDYYGRTVSIKILPVGIHMGQLQSIISADATAERVKQLREQYKGKVVILGVDDLDLFKGICLKFLAMGQLLGLHPELRGKVVLVQITNPARSSGKDVQQVENETNLVADEINRKYGEPGYDPIVYIKGPGHDGGESCILFPSRMCHCECGTRWNESGALYVHRLPTGQPCLGQGLGKRRGFLAEEKHDYSFRVHRVLAVAQRGHPSEPLEHRLRLGKL